ncbi:MAG: Cof-type HAD-IIB family hydrolase [Lachnospiraceae bacterium]|nr:Cof-type HAD-IIB family hydrolase [Lachnospiraceae bacterium]
MSTGKIKAAFFDIDGTLAAVKTHMIPESTRKALAALKEKGIYRIISTGRHPLEVEEENILPGLTFDGAIWLTGQFCELDKKCILQNCFLADQLMILKEFLIKNGRSCIFLEKDAMYCNLIDERILKEQAGIGTTVPPVRDIEDLEKREILQAVPFIEEAEEKELLSLLPSCKLTRWGEGVVDFLPGGGGKEQGILAICRAMGITPAEVIAFGDAENDISMLRLAGTGVAMGNGAETVKEAADYVTDPIDQDGIWNALVRFGAI